MSLTARKCLLALATSVLLLLALPGFAGATFPGTPGLVVFNLTAYQPGSVGGGLYAIRPGDEKPRQLTSNPYDLDPSFAPSGNQLVFERNNTNENGIYTLDLASGRTERITTLQSDHEPAFGPRGLIVFSHRFADKTPDLVLRTPEGRTRRLTSTPGTDSHPVFTPNGRRIVFSRTSRKTGKEQARLYSIRLDGSKLRALHALPRDTYSFDLAPNGRRLALGVFTDESSERTTSAAWTMRPDGSGLDVAAKNAFWPAYSPSGADLVYTNDKGLWQRAANGHGAPTLIYAAAHPHTYEGSLATYPAWQPLP